MKKHRRWVEMADGTVRHYDIDTVKELLCSQVDDHLGFEELAQLSDGRWLLHTETSVPSFFTNGAFLSASQVVNWMLKHRYSPPESLAPTYGDNQDGATSDEQRSTKPATIIVNLPDGRAKILDTEGAVFWPRCVVQNTPENRELKIPDTQLCRLESGHYVNLSFSRIGDSDSFDVPTADLVPPAVAAFILLAKNFCLPDDLKEPAKKIMLCPENDLRAAASNKVGGIPSSANRKRKGRAKSEPTNNGDEASESLRVSYAFPDNYWRNVWLYKQKLAGRTNAQLLVDLERHAEQYAPLRTENALRSAVRSIAHFHGWPEVKGQPGRPKASTKTPRRGYPKRT